MRLAGVADSLTLLGVLAVSAFCIFDEEPVLDFTDLNVLHVALFALSIAAILAELAARARYGHYLYKDTASLLAAMAFWLHIDNYVRAVWLILAFHALTPLEIDLIELVEAYHTAAAWLAAEILPALLCVAAAHGALAVLNLGVVAGRLRLLVGALLGLVALLATALILLTWDVALAGLSLAAEAVDVAAFYTQPKTALSYDQGRRVSDQFDWHRARSSAFVMRFEDLYFFIFRLLFLYTLLLTTGVWLLILVDFARQAARPLSYTQIAVGALWLEHAWVGAMLPVILVGAAGLRLLARAVAESSLFWG